MNDIITTLSMYKKDKFKLHKLKDKHNLKTLGDVIELLLKTYNISLKNVKK